MPSLKSITIPLLLITCAAVFQSCTPAVDAATVKRDSLHYLHTRYEGDFSIVYTHSLFNAGNFDRHAPYEVCCISSEYPGRNFYITIKHNGAQPYEVTDDQYPDLMVDDYLGKKWNAIDLGQDFVLAVDVGSLYGVNFRASCEVEKHLAAKGKKASYTIYWSAFAPDIHQDRAKYEKMLIKLMTSIDLPFSYLTIRSAYYQEAADLKTSDLLYAYLPEPKGFPHEDKILAKWKTELLPTSVAKIVADPSKLEEHIRVLK